MPKVAITRYLNESETPYQFTDQGIKDIRSRLEDLLTYLDWTSDRICGQSVLLKPNLVRPQPDTVPAVTTDPRVILALIDLFRDRGASKVAVGENPGWGLLAREAFRMAKLDTRIEDHGGIIELFDQEDPIEIDNPKATIFRKVLLPPQARRYDLIINLPKLKTHMHTTVSLGIKNLYGFVTDAQRLENHRNDLHCKLVDFLYVLKPDLTIIDGIWALAAKMPCDTPWIASQRKTKSTRVPTHRDPRSKSRCGAIRILGIPFQRKNLVLRQLHRRNIPQAAA